MEIDIQLTTAPIAGNILPPASGAPGAWLEFRGVVRGEENGQPIAALEYEAYPEMVVREIRRLLETLAAKHPCLAARVIHRVGTIPVGETAIYVGVSGRHRGEAMALLADFMDRLKQDVPIWKRRAVPVGARLYAEHQPQLSSNAQRAAAGSATPAALLSLDEAMAEINSRCQPLPPVCVSLNDSCGRMLRETVRAPEDLPSSDRSTRDGYAILADDPSESFRIVDTIHAADWKPRSLQRGEAVRVATGAALPCDGVRVVMQEHVERKADTIHIKKHEDSLNLRRRGEDMKAGQMLVETGAQLDAGKLALLATTGCARPLVNPRLRVAHFITGDELVSPEQTPQPGQIRDCNSSLIRGLLRPFQVELEQKHLPENFEAAWTRLDLDRIARADLVLVSGGASVGDQDFTRPLLERLGFEIVFAQVDLRPGRPLIFGMNGTRVAFGLPGNPLAHFVCFHFAVATVLARLSGAAAPKFLRGRLATKLADAACPRETLWPARLEWNAGSPWLHPLAWASSGDVTCLAAANALLRVPANCTALDADAELDFLPTTDMLGA
ncbi:MAG: molybdenum cofactor biosynthesis protein MoaE [Verrucomicrobiota bacterium]